MRRSFAALVGALLAGGCVVSTDAIVPEPEAALDDRLLGAWEEVDGSDRVLLTRGDGNAYVVEYTSGDRVDTLDARLGELGGRIILDVSPRLPEGLSDVRKSLLLAGHYLVAIEFRRDGLFTQVLEPDSLVAALERGELRVGHRKLHDQLVLHAETAELRPLLASYLARPLALGDSTLWRRVGAGSLQREARAVQVPCFEAAAWREADRLFRGDPHWLGADAASSVDLGDGRTLWLFADTWIDPAGRGSRDGARMVSNSVAVQTGADPSSATIAFHWGRDADGQPAALFSGRDGERLWFGSGVRVDDRLVLFFGRVVPTHTGLGFETIGWTAVLIENPGSVPSEWRFRWLEAPANAAGILLGFTGSLRLGEHVYALGSQNPVKSHPLFVARWRVQDARRGDLRAPEWWAGERLGWVPDSSSAQRWPLFENGQSELTLHFDSASSRFLAVHTRGFGPADLVMRAAPHLTGPWTDARMVYRPSEYHRPNVMIYAAKAHPQLAGADLVLTYATNTFDFGEHFTDPGIYYPRFVKLHRCERN